MSMNPFTPNFGQVPRHIAGRSQIISDIMNALDGNLGDPARTSILVGARGTGKTALLSYFAAEAEQHGWISINVTCIPGMLEDILQQVAYKAKEFVGKEKKGKIKGVSVGQLFSIEWETLKEDRQNWRTEITKVLDKFESEDIGLLITVDEVTASLGEMIELASIYQLLVRENRKISLLMAGLPSEVSSLLNDRSVSFLRRASNYNMGRIEDYEVEEAFENTVIDAGKEIKPEALTKAVGAVRGFPYMLQLVGYRAWQQAKNKKYINAEDVDKAIVKASNDFENRVLKATYKELSQQDIVFLKAMLEDENVTEISAIEKRIGKPSGYVSRYRARLIERGVIDSPRRGQVQFALPGMKEFLQEQE